MTVEPGPVEWVEMEKPLTLQDKLRLVEIAHETKDEEVKRNALNLLIQAFHPLRSAVYSHEAKHIRCGVRFEPDEDGNMVSRWFEER